MAWRSGARFFSPTAAAVFSPTELPISLAGRRRLSDCLAERRRVFFANAAGHFNAQLASNLGLC